jgi:hypothetical protein
VEKWYVSTRYIINDAEKHRDNRLYVEENTENQYIGWNPISYSEAPVILVGFFLYVNVL